MDTAQEVGTKLNEVGSKINSNTTKLVSAVKNEGEALLDSPMGKEIASQLQSLNDKVSEGYKASVAVLKKNPVTSVAVGITVGLLAGMLLTRKSNAS